MILEIDYLFNDVIEPQYATDGSSGFDLVVHNFKSYYPNGNVAINPNIRTEPAIKDGDDDKWYVPPRPHIPKQLHGVRIDSCKFEFETPVDNVCMYPGSRLLVGCGFIVSVPSGFEMQVRPRSGKALKEGITVVNSPGTVDSDYRGEVGIILINHSKDSVTINRGDKVAQGVIQQVWRVSSFERNTLMETERGSGGFGSTDRIGRKLPSGNKTLPDSNY